MANTVWKFTLAMGREQTVDMPVGAIPLHVGLQNELLCLWAQIDDAAPVGPRVIFIFGTGHPMPDRPGRYIGSFEMSNGLYIFHVYDAG